jgi:hypothetical protein
MLHQAKWGVVMAQQDTYKEVRTFNFPNMVVRVHIPDLTPDERARRMRAIHNQAAQLLKKVK